MHRFSVFFSVSLGVFFMVRPSLAAEVDCEDINGKCRVSNDNGDLIFCSCSDEGGDSGSGGDEWDGLDANALSEICEEELKSLCKPNSTSSGDADSGETGTDDTNSSATTTDDDDSDDTDTDSTVDDTGSDPNSVVCENPNGRCKYSQSGNHHSAFCECADGSGGATGSEGGDTEEESEGDSQVSEEELLEACNEYLNSCEPFDPPADSGVRCKNESGMCTVGHDGEDFIDCKCSDGLESGGTGGDDWENLSQEELLYICQQELRSCEDTELTTGEIDDTDTQSDGDTGDTGTSTSTTGADPTSDGGSEESGNDEGDANDSGSIDPHDIFDCRVVSHEDWRSQFLAFLGLLGLSRIRKTKKSER